MMTTKSHTDEGIRYSAMIDGTEAAFLLIDPDTRKVLNVETISDYARQGLARSLWESANADGECFHAVEHHRSEDGDAFAQAVGGETIDPELDHIDACYICAGDLDDMED